MVIMARSLNKLWSEITRIGALPDQVHFKQQAGFKGSFLTFSPPINVDNKTDIFYFLFLYFGTPNELK